MSFDGFVTNCIVSELCNLLIDGKIDKIYQPERDELILSVRTRQGSFRLLLSASASNPRIHLTTVQRENPMTPPMLCMLLRKHLTGAVITSITQQGFDRIVRIDTKARDELGDMCTRSVIIEIMGRHSNIILTDGDDKIIDSAKHIDFTVSAVRQILPGLIYTPAPAQDKTLPSDVSAPSLMNKLESLDTSALLDKFLVSEFIGMSPLLAREIVYRFCGSTHLLKENADLAAFAIHTTDFLKKICSGEFSPTLVHDRTEKRPIAFSCVELTQYENGTDIEKIPSMSAVVDAYFEKRSNREHMNRRSGMLLKLVHNNIERCEKKLALHRENLISAANRDKYKMYGDLLTANMYMLKYGMKTAAVQNFYSENGEFVEIPLKENISPSQNAQLYYKKYSKAKTTESYSKKQIKLAEDEKFYLESVASSLEKVETPTELDEIRIELMNEGYIPKQQPKKGSQKKQSKSSPMKFTSADGFEILVGRNNRQNDELTLKLAYSTDIWLHTKNIPGSHTIVRTNGTGIVPDTTLMQAAKIAAYHSKARASSQVPVDYTAVKNVKKPNGAKPGMVIYDHYNTVYVLPENGTDEQ